MVRGWLVFQHLLAPPYLPGIISVRASLLTVHHTQRTGRGFGIKHNPGLLQNPRFNLFVVNSQQVKRAADVVLFPYTLGCMALNLCADSAGYVEPFAQTGERTAQPVQGQFQPGNGAGLSVCMLGSVSLPDALAGLENTHSLRRGSAASRYAKNGVKGTARRPSILSLSSIPHH